MQPCRLIVGDDAGQASTTFACNGHVMESATLWLGLAGLLAIAVMMSRSFRGSVFIGIIFVTVIAWIPGHAASYLGANSPIPGTDTGCRDGVCVFCWGYGGVAGVAR